MWNPASRQVFISLTVATEERWSGSHRLGGWNAPPPHLMENSAVASIQAHLWDVGPHNTAWLSSTSLPPYLPAQLPGLTYPWSDSLLNTSPNPPSLSSPPDTCVFVTISVAAYSPTSWTLTSQSSSPVEASSLLFLLESDVFQLQRARDEANVAAFFHQAANPPVIVELL